MERAFTAMLTPDDGWFVARCREVNVVSQGETESEALRNLREALELYFEGEAEAPSEITVRAA